MLRVGVIGCGPIGALHAEAVCHSASATLVAVCDVAANAPRRFRGGWAAAWSARSG